MANAEHRTFESADEVRTFKKGRLELVEIGEASSGAWSSSRGWRWSEHVKPIAGTEWCEAPHFQYHARGTLRIQMTDGTEFDARPGELTALPAGHDAWVVGEEPAVMIDWHGASTYAREG
jgi:hypothetical protein